MAKNGKVGGQSPQPPFKRGGEATGATSLINDPSQLDRREITPENLRDTDIQKVLTDELVYRIEEAELEMKAEGMLEIWERDAYYYESYQVPVGNSNNFLKDYVKTQTGRLDAKNFVTKKNSNDQIWVVDNKIPEVVDGLRAEFENPKRGYTVDSDDYPRNDRIEWAVRKYLEDFQRRKRIWSNIRKPAIDKFTLYGLAWTECDYDAYILPQGDVSLSVLHPKDVLVDPLSRMDYFLDARYIVRKKQMELGEAKEFFKQFDIDPSSVTPDNDYNMMGSTTKDNPSNIGASLFVTVYYYEYRKMYLEETEVSADLHDAILEKQAEAGIGKNKAIKQKQSICFEAIYSKTTGVVSHKINKYADPLAYDQWQFKRIPLMDRPSEVRLYPMSRVEKLCNIQDIINIFESLMLDNTRNKNKLRWMMTSRLKSTYPDAMNDWISHGGGMEWDVEGQEGIDMKKELSFVDIPGISKDFIDFFEVMNKSMKDQGPRKEVLGGKLPGARGEYLSGKSIQKLQQANAMQLGPMASRIEWNATTELNMIYRIICQEFTEEDWAEFQDAKKGDPKYFPINATMTFAAFEEFLSKAYPGMEIPDATEKFEEHNMVETKYLMKDENGIPLDPKLIKQYYSRVFVNYMQKPGTLKMEAGKLIIVPGEPFKFNVGITLDYDVEKNKEEDLNRAMGLYQQGILPKRRLLVAMGGTYESDADQILEEKAKENEIEQMGKLVVEQGPEFEKFVQQKAQEFAMAKKQQPKQPQQAGAQG